MDRSCEFGEATGKRDRRGWRASRPLHKVHSEQLRDGGHMVRRMSIVAVAVVTVMACSGQADGGGHGERKGREGVMDLAAEVVMNRVSESYVKLVLAVGQHVRLDGVPGLATHGWRPKTLGDALRLRNRLLPQLERAAVEPDPERPTPQIRRAGQQECRDRTPMPASA